MVFPRVAAPPLISLLAPTVSAPSTVTSTLCPDNSFYCDEEHSSMIFSLQRQVLWGGGPHVTHKLWSFPTMGSIYSLWARGSLQQPQLSYTARKLPFCRDIHGKMWRQYVPPSLPLEAVALSLIPPNFRHLPLTVILSLSTDRKRSLASLCP